jgi:hypothetical protein
MLQGPRAGGTCLNEVRDQAAVEIFTAQVGVTGGGLDLKDAVVDGQQGPAGSRR